MLTTGHAVLPATHAHVSPHTERAIAAFTPPAAQRHRTSAGTYFRPTEGRRLSWSTFIGEILRWFVRPKTVGPSQYQPRRPEIQLATTELQVQRPNHHRSRIRMLRIFSFLTFNEFYEIFKFFSVEKNSQKIRNFANHRCLTCCDVLECNVHL